LDIGSLVQKQRRSIFLYDKYVNFLDESLHKKALINKTKT